MTFDDELTDTVNEILNHAHTSQPRCTKFWNLIARRADPGNRRGRLYVVLFEMYWLGFQEGSDT